MRVKTVPSTWIMAEGRRLDSGPFMSGALEARIMLSRLSCPVDRLRNVTRRGIDGIVNAGRVRRLWVTDPAHGIPFLSSSDILQADLSYAPLISNKVVAENPKLVIHQGWTLITRSGTIGRMVYARPDMDGMGCSEDVMRVIADPERIPAGYLYAFLSGKYGVPMITARTYGAIIQHLEPQHIADLPVPRLGEAVEQRAHALVEEAAVARSKATVLRHHAQERLSEFAGNTEQDVIGVTSHFVTSVTSKALRRLDATYHNPSSVSAAKQLASAGEDQATLSDVCKVFSTDIFKRIHVSDPNYGYAYYSGSELFQIAPTERGYLSRKATGIRQYLVYTNWLLIQDAGQLGGLIGRLTRVPKQLDGAVVSNHLMRIVPNSRVDAGYLFAVLNSPLGYRAITRNAFGSSIPQLDPVHIGAIKVPWPGSEVREQIAAPILESWDLEDRAVQAELEAVALVEQAIEGAA